MAEVPDTSIGNLSVQNLHLKCDKVFLSWREDECPKEAGLAYLLRTVDGPMIATWDNADSVWVELQSGRLTGIPVRSMVTGWQDITPW